MSKYIDIPGSGRIRLTTAGDVSRAIEARRSPPPDTRRSLVASASRLGPRDATQYSKRLTMPWQYRALSHFDLIGELHFACHFIARQLSRCRFYPAMLQDDGTTEPIESGPPVDIWNRVQDPGGGRSQLQYDFGRLCFITGEGTLFGYDLDSDFQRWKFLWKDEVRILDDGTAVRLDYQGQPTKQVGIGYRFWAPHPRHSDLADSPLRAVADVAEELIILTQAVRATATSRMTNGIMILPLEAIPNPADVSGDEDPESNPFLEDYIQHITAQLENYGSPEAAASFLYTPPYEYADRVSWLKTHDPATDYMEKDLRVEAINRLALGLDMPPEALQGLGQVNHWGGKAIQLDMWRAHGVNKADLFAESAADAYLRPSLEAEGFAEWSRVVLEHDDSQVVISPDRTDDALKAQAQGIINNAAAREALGWADEDALEGEEKDEFFALKLREPSLIDGIALPARGPIPANNGNADASSGPPQPSGGRPGSRQEALRASAEINGAAVMALHRCRELAGVRIRHKCKECAQGEPDSLVAAVMGQAQVADPLKLVQGGTDGFRNLLELWKIEAVQASALCQMIERWAAKTLFEAKLPSLPAGFVAQVETAKELSEVYSGD